MKSTNGNQGRNYDDPLFDRLHARSSDPETSHTAARNLRESGRLGSQCAAVLAAVAACPGMTSAELAAGDVRLRYVFARRLPDLERMGLVRKGVARECAETGHEAVTWWRVG